MDLCRLCGGQDLTKFGTGVLIGRHRVGYYECQRCGYIQTEKPWWLAEAYELPINSCDTGSVQRVIEDAITTKGLIAMTCGSRGKFLDYGGGYGIFVRRMRDLGLNFLWSDRYCRNLLAPGFEADPAESGFEIATCFEVLEHVEQPLDTIKLLLQKSEAVLFSTEIASESLAGFWDWFYLGKEHGQHIGFLRKKTLHWMENSLKVHVLTNGTGLHLFSKKPVSKWKWKLATSRRCARALNLVIRYGSLTEADGAHMRAVAESARRSEGNTECGNKG